MPNGFGAPLKMPPPRPLPPLPPLPAPPIAWFRAINESETVRTPPFSFAMAPPWPVRARGAGSADGPVAEKRAAGDGGGRSYVTGREAAPATKLAIAPPRPFCAVVPAPAAPPMARLSVSVLSLTERIESPKRETFAMAPPAPKPPGKPPPEAADGLVVAGTGCD